MTKTIISNPYQSQNRQNLLKAGGLKNIDDTITPKNGERIYGKVGEVRFNQLAQNNGNDTGTITPPDCPDCPPIDPPTDPDNPTPDTPQGCTCRSLDELGDYIAQKASESFCENTPVEDDNQYFPCLTGADGGELRISCPQEDCGEKYRCFIRFSFNYTCLDNIVEDKIEEKCASLTIKEILKIANEYRMKYLSFFDNDCLKDYEYNKQLEIPFTEENCNIVTAEYPNTPYYIVKFDFPITSLGSSIKCGSSISECMGCNDPEGNWCLSFSVNFACGSPECGG